MGSILHYQVHVCARKMYVQGKCMRPASLDDIENADSWDFESVRALMGNGCLYVVQENKPVELLSTSSSESEVSIVWDVR